MAPFCILPIALLFSLLLTPGEIIAQRNKTGGSCSYHYTNTPAVVLYMYPSGKTRTEIVFSVDAGNGTDTVSYSSINHSPVPNDTVKKYNIHRGDVFMLRTGHMYEGSCNPLVLWFVLKKYEKDTTVAGAKANEKPCTYTQSLREAYALSVVPVNADSSTFDIYFLVASTRVDTISFSQINKRYVSAGELKQYTIQPGISLTFEENFINTGVCEPYTRAILFEAYERKK